MTSVPLPACQNGSAAKREKSTSKFYTEDRTRLPRYNVPSSSKMNVFQSISSFLRKNKKVTDRTEQARKSIEKDRVSLAESTSNDDKKVEEDWAETSEISDDNRDDIAFVRSTFRQSVKRAMGWRKSQRKAVNKRKKENIQNSKLLTGGTRDTGDDEFYDDTELDVVVVTETDGVPEDPRSKPSSSSSKHSKIPRRRNSTKRPAVSLKSSGFFSQSVASKRSDVGKTVTARTNKASELREVAIKKRLENSPAQSTTVPVPPPTRRKPRTSFRTKKAMARRPVHKKEIKPAENKASQLRAKKHQEEGGEEEIKLTSDPNQSEKTNSNQSEKTNSNQRDKSKEAESKRTDRYSSVSIKTPAPSYETRDPLSAAQSPRRDSATVRTSGRAVKTVPQKPTRSKIPSTSSTNSSIPTPSPRLAPSSLPLSKSSDDFQTRKYSGRSEKTSSHIPKPRLSSPQDPTKELVFIPLDSVSLPLPNERKKIDEVKRKRKIQRPAASPKPVSNIFDGGSGDLPPSNLRRQVSTDDSDTVFTVHVNKTPARSVSTTPKPRTSVSKPLLSSSVPITSAIPNHLIAPRKNSTGCVNKTTAKPKQVQNLSTFKRQNSIDSTRRSKKGIPAISRLSESCHSESSDNTCSYDSCRSLDDDEISVSRSPPLSNSPSLTRSPPLSHSPELSKCRISVPKTPVLISTDELETQKEKLRTPRKRSGSIRVKQVRTRKSWLRPEVEIIDPEIEKVKTVLSDEVLIIEDLISGHQDILQTLSSRTLVLKNLTSALRRNDTERAARMCVSLCFPRSHSDTEFKTMRRACQCNTDDLALFQNCLSLILVEREKLTLPVVGILLSKVRFTFEVLGTEVLRGNIGETLKFITGNFGTKIAHRHSTPGINYRLQEIAETCYQELVLVKKHVLKLTAVDYSPELMALKKTLELFDL